MGAGAGMAQIGIGGLQILEAKNQADAIKRQSEFDAKQAEFNASLIDVQIDEVNRQAKDDIHYRQTQIKRIIGDQKTSFAGQNVDLDSEVVALLEDEERSVGHEDVQTIKNNAWREAMGLEIEQADIRLGAKMTRLSGREEARATLASGGLGGVSSIVRGASKFKSTGSYGRSNRPSKLELNNMSDANR